jgi:hypothetical protein
LRTEPDIVGPRVKVVLEEDIRDVSHYHKGNIKMSKIAVKNYKMTQYVKIIILLIS